MRDPLAVGADRGLARVPLDANVVAPAGKSRPGPPEEVGINRIALATIETVVDEFFLRLEGLAQVIPVASHPHRRLGHGLGVERICGAYITLVVVGVRGERAAPPGAARGDRRGGVVQALLDG